MDPLRYSIDDDRFFLDSESFLKKSEKNQEDGLYGRFFKETAIEASSLICFLTSITI